MKMLDVGMGVWGKHPQGVGKNWHSTEVNFFAKNTLLGAHVWKVATY